MSGFSGNIQFRIEGNFIDWHRKTMLNLFKAMFGARRFFLPAWWRIKLRMRQK